MPASAKHEVFRFMNIRPAERIDAADAITMSPADADSAFGAELMKHHVDPAGQRQRTAIAERFMASKAYVKDLESLDPQAAAFDARLRGSGDPDLKMVQGMVREVFSKDAAGVVASDGFRKTRAKLIDSLLAAVTAPKGRGAERSRLIRGVRIAALLEALARNDPSLNAPHGVARTLGRLVVLPADLLPAGSTPGGRRPAAEPPAPVQKTPLSQFESVRRTMETLSALSGSDFADVDQSIEQPLMRSATPKGPIAGEAKKPPACGILPPAAIRRLPPDVADVLKGAGIDVNAVPVQQIADRISRLLVSLQAERFPPPASTAIVRVGNRAVHLMALTADASATASGAPQCSSARPVGVADLLVVKQTISRYEMGEIAHIENVLQGESKERTHRRASKTEETFTAITETSTEKERDLQTAERFELQREAAETIKEDTKLDAGVTVSGSYGSVHVTAHANVAAENAKEESHRAASTYSRDVTDRSVSRIQERVQEERVRRITQEIEEINRHGIDNKAGAEHTIGVYRFVDKLYRAEIVNYGRRLMFEFIVPEPAALLLHAMGTRPPEGVTLERPDPPSAIGTNTPLAPHDIEPWNYQYWVAQYRVASVAPPPDLYRVASMTYKTEEKEEPNKTHYENATSTIELPDSYLPLCGYVSVAHIPNHNNEQAIVDALRAAGFKVDPAVGTDLTLSISLGRRSLVFESVLLSAHAHVSMPEGAVVGNGLPVAIAVTHSVGAALTVEVLCRAGDRLLDDWRSKTYDAIITAYLNLKSAYDEQIAASDVRQGVAITGTNPAENREVEKTELKRAAVSLLACREPDLGAIVTGPAGYPALDFATLDEDGRPVLESEAEYIQFFEQAFEWPQLTYLFYPYFWARRPRWLDLLHLQDTDPLRAQFLQAGAARVLVPVRPGYEGAILRFIGTGDIWSGGGPPDVTSPEYFPLAEELREMQGAGPDGIAVGEPWEIRLPTPLVILQRDSTLPQWPVA